MNSDRLSKNLWFAYFCALVFWGGNVYLEIFRYLQNGTLFARLIDGRPYTSDFVLYYNAAVLAAQCGGGKTINIYDPLVQNTSIIALTAPIVPELNFYMQYPPQFFALVKPLAGLGLSTSWTIWCALAIFALIIPAMYWLTKDMEKAKFTRAFIFAAVLASFPAWISVELGQTALFQFGFLMLFFLLLRSQRFFLAGLISMFLLVKLQYVPIILAVGLIIGRLRYLGGFLLSGLALAGLTISSLGWSNVINYPQALLYGETSDKVSGVSGREMQNFRGELILLLRGHEDKFVHLAAVAFFGAALLLLSALWIWGYPKLKQLSEKSEHFAFDVCASLTTLLMLIASPHTHTQDFLSCAIPCYLLYRCFDLSTPTNGRLKALRNLILAFPILSWVFFILKFLFQLAFMQPFFIWAVAVLSLTILELKANLDHKELVSEQSPS